MFEFRIGTRRRTFTAAVVAMILAGCGGGGGGSSAVPPPGGTPTPVPTSTPTFPSSSTKTLTVNTSGPSSASFDTITGGIGASVTMPAGTGAATLTATLTATPPGGVPAVSDAARRPKSVGGTLTPLAYLTVTSSGSVQFKETPGVVFTPAGATAAYGYLAAYDPTNGWTAIAGATTLVGGKLTFSPIGALYTVTSSNSVFAVFTTASLASVAPPGNTDPVKCSAYAESPAGQRRAPQASALLATVSPDRLYVTYRAGERTASSVRGAVGVIRTLSLGSENGLVHEAITLPPGTDATTAAAQLRATSGVVDVAPVHRRFVEADAAANDALLDNVNQWYLYRTNVESAWTMTHGTGIKVAVIDTGVDQTNQDLAPKLDKTASYVGGVVTTSAQDTNGHGTNVSGLVAASTNNNYGFAGTGWDVHLLVYKIFPDATATSDCQSADTADEAAAIRDAVANGASVISLSLGSSSVGVPPDQPELNAINYAMQNGVTVVAANGNSGPNHPPDYPAAYPGVIAVGASSVNDTTANVYSSITFEQVASYSNDNPTLVAPGGDAAGTTDPDQLHWITGYSTTTAGKIGDRCSNSGGVCEVLFNGTSQATPQVAGAVALMMAKHGGPRSLQPSAVMQILKNTADKTVIQDPATRQGAGRLNVGNAVAASS